MKKLTIIAGFILAALFPAQQLVHQPVQSFQTTAYNAKRKLLLISWLRK